MMNKLKFLFPIIYLGLAGPVWSDFAQTPQEQQLCKSMGIANHECDCIRFLNRAYAARDKTTRNFILGEAIGGCQYHLTHSPGDAWNPIAHLQIGLSQQLQEKPIDAIASFHKALQLNPRLERAHSEMANIYLKLNNKKQALDVVTEGLRWLPDSRALQRSYQRLGGVLPYPAAHNKEAAPTDTAPEHATGKTDGTGTGGQPATVPLPKSVPDPTQPTPGSDSGAAPTSDPIGSPTNPWCRFCPDTPAAPPASSPSTPGVVPKDWK